MRRILLILNLVYIYYCSTQGQDVQIKAGFDSSNIYIGDQIKYSITVEKPQNYNLTLPYFKDTVVKNIEILEGPVVDSSIIDNGKVRIRHEYLVTSFDSGFYMVPPVYTEIKTESGVKRYYSDYSWLKVMRVKMSTPDTTSGIFDIIDPGKVPVTVGEIIPWITAIFVAGVLIWLSSKLWKQMKKSRKMEIKPETVEPAHVIAFRELEKLKSEKLWQKGEIKQYYSRLTEIIRQYIWNRYSIPALEMTTVDTLDTLLKNGIKDNESYRKLRTILTGGDLVKFAKYQPEPSENDLHYEYAWDYVKSTMLITQPQVEEIKAKNVKEEIL
ncbi:MAG: hypothetical protein ACUVTX_00630 [Bacteroidales bacterium]